MRRTNTSTALLALLLLLPLLRPPAASAEEAPETVPPWEQELEEPPVELFVLENGLTVLLQADPRYRHVAVSVSYAVGGRDQLAGFRGLAHLTEHLMFQGARHVGEDQHFGRLQRVGATAVNAATGPDRTTYYEVLPAHQLETALWLESDRMAYMLDHLDEQTLEEQRAVVLSEFAERHGGTPLGRLDWLEQTRLYPPGHPYLQCGDDVDDLARLTVENVQWFFQRWYAPHNARLAIVGGFDLDEARALVERYFGGIRASTPPVARDEPRRPVELAGERRVVFGTAHPRTRIQIVWPTPAFLLPGDAELDFVMHLLGGGPLSRLHRRLVSETGLADAVHARQASYELESTFFVSIVLAAGARPEAAIAVVDDELRRLAAAPVSRAEFDRVGLVIETRVLLSSESLDGRAHMLSAWSSPLAEDGIYRLADDYARYAAVTPESVAATVREFLPTDRRLVLISVPRTDASIEGMILEEELIPATSRGGR